MLENCSHLNADTADNLIWIISSGQPIIADVNQFSRFLAKFRIDWVNVDGIGRKTSGINTSTMFW